MGSGAHINFGRVGKSLQRNPAISFCYPFRFPPTSSPTVPPLSFFPTLFILASPSPQSSPLNPGIPTGKLSCRYFEPTNHTWRQRFLSRVSILTRDIDIANLSVVRPSVCLSVRNVPVSDESCLTYRHSFFHHTVSQSF